LPLDMDEPNPSASGALGPDWDGVGYKLVAKVGSRYYSVWAGKHVEYTIGSTLKENAKLNYKGGYYFCKTLEAVAHAVIAPQPGGLHRAPRVILRCQCAGPFVEYSHGKFACSQLTPLEEVPHPALQPDEESVTKLDSDTRPASTPSVPSFGRHFSIQGGPAASTRWLLHLSSLSSGTKKSKSTQKVAQRPRSASGVVLRRRGTGTSMAWVDQPFVPGPPPQPRQSQQTHRPCSAPSRGRVAPEQRLSWARLPLREQPFFEDMFRVR